MAQVRQLSLDFSTPGDHAERVHAGARHGTVLFWERAQSGDRWIKCRPGDDLPGIANQLRGHNDAYFSVNEFDGWRQVRLLRSLRAVYVDLDGQQDLDLVLEVLSIATMPAPSFVVWSGRGLHLYWSIDAVPSKALPVWQRVQDALIKTLTGIGADPACRDCTRVLRLSGTINTKSATETRGLVLHPWSWSLHTLADEVLGHKPAGRPRAQVRDFDAAKARKGRKGVLQGSIYGWWHAVYSDLVTLTNAVHKNQISEGQRDKWLFLHAVALSWFAQPDSLTDEIISTGRLITDFTDAEILRLMNPVISRRNDADAGHKVTWDGKERDPRYFFTSETLRSWIGRDLVEQHAPVLRALAPASVIQERKADRDKSRWSDHNSGMGYRLGNEEKRATARLMRAGGDSFQSIADTLGVSVGSVHKWCKD